MKPKPRTQGPSPARPLSLPPVRRVSTRAYDASDPAQRHAAIQNHLSEALWHMRQPSESVAHVVKALARANRAFSLLKREAEALGLSQRGEVRHA